MINRWILSTQRHLQSIFKNTTKEDGPWPGPHFRLCHLQKQPGQAYGFTVLKREDVLSSGHVIAAVSPGSPACLSNLRVNDRIIEVNGCNVENENYEQLSNRIKAGLCLADSPPEADCDRVPKDILESLSSNDSGLASEDVSVRKEQYRCTNQCLLLVLDPQSYSAYRLNRSTFVSSAPVVYKQPAKVKASDLPEDISNGNDKTSNKNDMVIGLADTGIHTADSELLSSSNESFDDLESHVDSSVTINDAAHSNGSTVPFPHRDGAMTTLPQENRFAPRLCYLKKVDGFQGYGFNLVCPRNSNVQVIGKVEPGSPANMAGLLNDDIVIEVNGVNILNENHRQVVARITEGLIKNGRRHRDEVVLLVVDPEAKRWYDEKGISINYNLPNILAMGGFKSGDVQLGKADDSTSLADTASPMLSMNKVTIENKTDQPTRKLCKASIEVTINNPARTAGVASSAPCTPSARTGKLPSDKLNGSRQFGVYLDMTAAEMREILKKRGGKRNMVDRYNNLTMREKYKIVQNM